MFSALDSHLARQGCVARGGRILGTSIVPVPRNPDTRDENAAIKKSEVPQDRAGKPASRVQKDVGRRGTRLGRAWDDKYGKSHYGCKNHMNVDRTHKLAWCCHVSDAALHDSHAMDHPVMRGNTGSGVRPR